MFQGKMQVEKAQEKLQGSLDNTPIGIESRRAPSCSVLCGFFMPAFLLAEIPLP